MSANTEQVPIELSLELKTVPVTLEGNPYSLVELTGDTRDKYMTDMSQRMKYDAKGKPTGLKSFNGLQAMLLTLCLHNQDNELVKAADIQKYPSSTLTTLFEMAQELNGIGEPGEDEAKNE